MKKPARSIPFDFIFEELHGLSLRTKPMFGCHSVYLGEKIIFILRLKGPDDPDNGVWLATTPEYHASLQSEFPNMRSLVIFGPGVTGWQVLPLDADDFESSVLRACQLVRAQDPRIGKIPKAKLPKKSSKKKTSKSRKSEKAAKFRPKTASRRR